MKRFAMKSEVSNEIDWWSVRLSRAEVERLRRNRWIPNNWNVVEIRVTEIKPRIKPKKRKASK